MKSKLGLTGLVTLGALKLFSGADAKANSYLDIWNWSDHGEVPGVEYVNIVENGLSGEYLPTQDSPAVRIYGWGPTIGNPNDHKLGVVGITPYKINKAKLFLTADVGVPNGADNYLFIEDPLNPLNFARRNFVMRQDPNSPSPHKDPNLYDLLDLTDYFTKSAQINLPGITASTPRTPEIYDKWNLIVSNYADFFMPIPDGRVNWKDFAHMSLYWGRQDCGPENHWCEYSDLNRDGNVDMKDLGHFSEEWLYDSNDPNTW